MPEIGYCRYNKVKNIKDTLEGSGNAEFSQSDIYFLVVLRHMQIQIRIVYVLCCCFVAGMIVELRQRFTLSCKYGTLCRLPYLKHTRVFRKIYTATVANIQMYCSFISITGFYLYYGTVVNISYTINHAFKRGAQNC